MTLQNSGPCSVQAMFTSLRLQCEGELQLLYLILGTTLLSSDKKPAHVMGRWSVEWSWVLAQGRVPGHKHWLHCSEPYSWASVSSPAKWGSWSIHLKEWCGILRPHHLTCSQCVAWCLVSTLGWQWGWVSQRQAGRWPSARPHSWAGKNRLM